MPAAMVAIRRLILRKQTQFAVRLREGDDRLHLVVGEQGEFLEEADLAGE
jgi:hypothetical protein